LETNFNQTSNTEEIDQPTEEVDQPTCILEYSELMDTAQLSAARLVDIPGAVYKNSFAEIIAGVDENEREQIIQKVGAEYDKAFVDYVSATIAAYSNRHVIILAESSEGINGYFPWQEKLHERVNFLIGKKVLNIISLSVERYTKPEAVNQLEDNT